MNRLCCRLGRPFWLSLGLLALAFLAYWPGLDGPFLLDDIFNLKPLGYRGGIDSVADAWRFVFGNGSGPGGRPLSMLSFLLNARDWPASPWGFKLTNVLLHLGNGMLVMTLLRQLAVRWALPRGWAFWVAAVWVLHPGQVTGVLYVIQRMNVLSTLFVLLALNGYVYARLQPGLSVRRRWLLIGVSLGVGLVGVLAKENAILLFLYALVLEGTVLRRETDTLPDRRRWLLCALLGLPLLATMVFIALNIPGYIDKIPHRGYEYGQHLLTMPRMLMRHVFSVLWPDIRFMGVYHDDIVPSVSLWSPLTTIPSLLALSGLLWSSWHWRRRAPWVSLGVGWFLAGHALETSVIPLELYFEHRNYLPSLGLLILLGVLGYQAHRRFRSPRGVRVAAMAVVLAVFSLTAVWARTWGHDGGLLMHQAYHHPNAARAQQALANFLENRGRAGDAERVLALYTSRHPDATGFQIKRLYLKCRYGLDSPVSVATVQESPVTRASYRILHTMRELVGHVIERPCEAVPLSSLHAMLGKLEASPVLQKRRRLMAHLYFLHADVYVVQRRLGRAIEALDQSYAYEPVLDVALKKAVLLGSAGLYEEALKALALAMEQDRQRRWGTPSRMRELRTLQTRFQKQLRLSNE